ncbi:MAG: glycosyltransferase family 2 protein [Lachnospiraceae bacterium]|jgi:glycosyltransferase involved in cell wall biosynthesis
MDKTQKIQWGRLIRKLSPYMIIKGIRYLRHFGLKEFWIRLQERFEPEEIPYGPWFLEGMPTEEELEAQRAKQWEYQPKISILVPAYRTPEEYLRQMIKSVQAQTYGNWELCIANASPEDEQMCAVLKKYAASDKRICVQNLLENKGIADNTNAAIAMASGEYIGLLDHDDALAPQALYEIVKALNGQQKADVIYTDEDKISADLKEHFAPNLKPDFNLDLLRSNNYICHFFVCRRTLAEAVGGFSKEYDGAQDYDFIFRCVEAAECILHIPEILYHWRTHQASTADNPLSKMYAFDAGQRAIEAHLRRMGEEGTVSKLPDLGFYRVKYPVKGSPLVSIIIPNRDEKETLQTCLESIFEKTSYEHYEIIIVENNSTSPEIFAYYEELKKRGNVRVVVWDQAFNYSAINNYGITFAKGEYYLLLNNDTAVITPDWIEEMLGNCQRSQVGITGVKLFYPDDTIQHAGCIVGMGGVAGHMFVDMQRERSGYLHKASLQQNLSAVTAACMMITREAFETAGGFTEELQVAFNDVDLCLKVRKAGYLIVYDPFVQLYHYESKSRGAEDSKEKVRRFQREIAYMRSHWTAILKTGDPYYNPNLSLTKWNYSLKPREK